MSEKRTKGCSLQVFRQFESGQIGQGGVEINQFDHGFGSGSTPCYSWNPHDKGNLCSNVEEGHLSPQEVITQVIAMIRSENDNGVFPVAALLQGIKDQFQLGIDEGDAGMIGLHVFPAEGVVLLAQFEPEGAVAFRDGGFGKSFPEVGPVGLIDDPVQRVEVEIFVRSKEGNVWLLDSAGD